MCSTRTIPSPAGRRGPRTSTTTSGGRRGALDGTAHRSAPLRHDVEVVGPAAHCWIVDADLSGRAAALSLENWATEMAAGLHTTVAGTGKDLGAAGAASASKLRSMFTDFEWVSSTVVGVGLEAAMVGKVNVRRPPSSPLTAESIPRAVLGHQRESPGTSGAAYTGPERVDGCARSRFEISGTGKGLKRTYVV